MSAAPEFDLTHCTLCPHSCGANRAEGNRGFCGLDAGLHIAKICLHRGEEPIPGSETGVCNVFFSQCNLRCEYCQNFQISQSQSLVGDEITRYEDAVGQIVAILQGGVGFLGFVSPTSHVPHMVRIVEMLHERGFSPKVICNTNAYDSVETLRQIENIVDIYLPDFKYANESLGKTLSAVADYPNVARRAIAEMYRQKKDVISEENPALIVRHLVLPNCVANSLDVLETIHDVCGTNVFLSLMSQYFPVHKATSNSRINRTLHTVEYDIVLEKMDELGFDKGWTQQLESNDYYQPDFSKRNPFEG